MNEFEGNIRNREPKTEKQWKEESNQVLEERNAEYRVYNRNWHGFLVFFSILSMIAFLVIASFFVYYVREDKFKPSVNLNITVTPLFNSNITVSNNFQPPQTTNTYNIPIYNNITVVTNHS